MADRLALVIGSECANFGRLGFTAELAEALLRALTELGGWRPVGDGPVLDPTVAELKTRLKAAFQQADRCAATLLIAFIGHGFTTGRDDFFLLAHDSELPLDYESGLHLVDEVTRQLTNTGSLDGLIVLVDACEAGPGVLDAGRKWVPLLEQGSGRMELLAASDRGDAYDGCFTRTMLRTFETGLPGSGSNLLCAELAPELNAACSSQTPRHLSFNGTQVARGDLGLWLVPNRARSRDAVTGRPAAGLVDHLVRTVSLTDAVRDTLADLVESGDRLQVLTGPAGAGKSTLLSLLIRPGLVAELSGVNAEFVTAAVFLDVSSTVETMHAELVEQLETRFGAEFRDARQAVLDELVDRERFSAFETDIVRPLHRMQRPGRRIRLVIDGLDQPDEGCRNSVIEAVGVLSGDERLRQVRVIVGVRSGTEIAEHPDLAHARRFRLAPPSGGEILSDLIRTRAPMPREIIPMLGRLHDDLGGGWLIARLVTEIDWNGSDSEMDGLDSLVARRFEAAARRRPTWVIVELAALLAAVGVGPTAPLRLIHAALAQLGESVSLSHLRDVVVDLGVLVARGHPGQDGELVGLAHHAFTEPLARVVSACLPGVILQAQRALSDVLDVRGALRSGVLGRRSTGAGAPAGAAVLERPAPTGDYGAVAAAVGREGVSQVVPAADGYARPPWRRVRSSNRAARRRAKVAHFIEPRPWDDEFADYAQHSGPRHLIECGDHQRAIAFLDAADSQRRAVDNRMAWESWLSVFENALPLDHSAVLTARSRLARWTGYAGEPHRAREMCADLADYCAQTLGPDHPQTLLARAQLADWYGQTSEPARAAAIFIELLPRLERAGDIREVLRARMSLGFWTGQTGDSAGAREHYAAVLPAMERIFGRSHPEVLNARDHYARWIGETGDPRRARRMMTRLVPRCRTRLGRTHNTTLWAMHNLALWTAACGDAASAIELYRRVIAVRDEVSGTEHPSTIATKLALARLYAANGNYSAALEVGARLPEIWDRTYGPADPVTVAATREVAEWTEKLSAT
ncbi:tetratricopeptide repeat protein [Nocardia arthritidis]|nr:tetratricopeptide repeat protein [Nocardia arthritidis]